MPRLSGCRSGWRPGSLPSAPLPAPRLHRGVVSLPPPAVTGGRRGRFLSACIRRAAAGALLSLAALFALPALPGAGTAWADSLTSNLGQTTSATTVDPEHQGRRAGLHDRVDRRRVRIHRGEGRVRNRPERQRDRDGVHRRWSRRNRHRRREPHEPADLEHGQHIRRARRHHPRPQHDYYLIIEATDGILASTSSGNEDSGGVSGWFIVNGRYNRAMVSDSGLGGAWSQSSNTLHISVEGDHKGAVTTCSAASMEDQVWTGNLTVGEGSGTRGFGPDRHAQ